MYRIMAELINLLEQVFDTDSKNLLESAIETNLKMSYENRIEAHENARQLLIDLRSAGEKNGTRSQSASYKPTRE